MFTGIIGDVGRVMSVAGQGDLRARITADRATAGLAIGGAVACDGVRLTVVAVGQAPAPWFEVQISAETQACTALGAWAEGAAVNLERPLRVGDELGGHIVSGHVDGVAAILGAVPEAGCLRLRLRVDAALARFIAPKGAIALNGVSLTVNEVAGCDFGVNLIPHTRAVTNLGHAAAGGRLNVEVDTMARYVARLAEWA